MLWEAILYYLDPANMLFTRTIIILILILMTVLDWIFNLTFKHLFLNTLNAIINKENECRCLLYQCVEARFKKAPLDFMDKVKRSVGIYKKMDKKDRALLSKTKAILKKYKVQSCCDLEKCNFSAELKNNFDGDHRFDCNKSELCDGSKCPLFSCFEITDGSTKIYDLNDIWNTIWRGSIVRCQQTNFFWAITIQLIIFLGSLRGFSSANNFEFINNLINVFTIPLLLICVCLLAVSYGSTRPVPLFELKVLRLSFLVIMFGLMIYVSKMINSFSV
jgi:hypothetical protein